MAMRFIRDRAIEPNDYFDFCQTLSPWQLEMLIHLFKDPERLRVRVEIELEHRDPPDEPTDT